MAKIYVNVISRHQGHWAMFSAFQRAASIAQQAGHICYLAPRVGDSLVCRARNASMADFLETDCDYFFTLDDDIALPDEAFTKLIDAGKDYIGGLYRLKFRYRKDIDVVDTIATRLLPDKTVQLGTDQIQEVKYLSTGCIMHTRQFCEDMWNSYYEDRWYRENQTKREIVALYTPLIEPELREYLSEDWAFTYRAQKMGVKAYVHANVLCDHWGLERYSFTDIFDDYGEEKGEVDDDEDSS
jgi:hypothetical protein